jgi:hypothetical protein
MLILYVFPRPVVDFVAEGVSLVSWTLTGPLSGALRWSLRLFGASDGVDVYFVPAPASMFYARSATQVGVQAFVSFGLSVVSGACTGAARRAVADRRWLRSLDISFALAVLITWSQIGFSVPFRNAPDWMTTAVRAGAPVYQLLHALGVATVFDHAPGSSGVAFPRAAELAAVQVIVTAALILVVVEAFRRVAELVRRRSPNDGGRDRSRRIAPPPSK